MKAEDFTIANISGLRICFRANSDIRLFTGTTTRSDGLKFKDLDHINDSGSIGDGSDAVGQRHSWGASYKGIRQASIFIQNVDMNMKITEQEKADFKAQARFVRAYYYWLLLRRYGPIPLLPEYRSYRYYHKYSYAEYTTGADCLESFRNSHQKQVGGR